MKKRIKIVLFFFCITSFFLPFLNSATCATTQWDTTFGVDEGDSFLWTVISGSPDFVGYKYNMTVEDIYNGSYMLVDSYIIDATVRFYNATEDTWYTQLNDAFFVAANETQNFIAYTGAFTSLYFIIPTPINLTMLGEWAVYTGLYTGYTISGSRIDLNLFLAPQTYNLTFNSDGILTKHVTTLLGLDLAVMVLSGGGGGDTIPGGYYFIIFTVIGAIALIYLEKRKIR